MARVHCSTPSRSPNPSQSASPATVELALVAIRDDACTALANDGVSGPGWFESSWDLRRGLVVREGLPADANLSEWLMNCLGSAPSAPYRATTFATTRATASPRSMTAIA